RLYNRAPLWVGPKAVRRLINGREETVGESDEGQKDCRKEEREHQEGGVGEEIACRGTRQIRRSAHARRCQAGLQGRLGATQSKQDHGDAAPGAEAGRPAAAR
ncbi:MAG TPA: hypothetical protein VF193_15350, partial [Steroidobacter sp.]